MGVETTNGTINGEKFRVESSVGTKGWMQMEGPVVEKKNPTSGSNEKLVFDRKATGHRDGNIHYHTKTPDGSVREVLEKAGNGEKWSGNTIGKVIK